MLSIMLMLACSSTDPISSPEPPFSRPDPTERVAEVAEPAPDPGPATPTFDSRILPIPDDLQQKMRGVSMHDGCPVGFDGLRLLEVSHLDYEGELHTGRLIVAAEHAEALERVFRELWDADFRIHSMRPVHEFDGSDDKSMAANNTSAFNCRAVTGGTAHSQHSYGNALDLNPLTNPYVRGDQVLPPEGSAWLDRTVDVPGLVKEGDGIVEAFAAEGFKWGGHWEKKKDYQHFSSNGR